VDCPVDEELGFVLNFILLPTTPPRYILGSLNISHLLFSSF